ncbi:MAG: putative RDD family membrane protein YckC [Crocinitomix sp.]|jgi:uncharacterized RDD family membrane protein YckC
MKKITDLKKTVFTTKETKNASGQFERQRIPIEVTRAIHTIHPGLRFGHFFIDALVITASMYFLQYLGLFSRSTPFVWMNCCDGSGGYYFNYAGILVIAIYYFLMEALLGRTVGKYVSKTCVINEYAVKPPIPTILIRTLCRLIPFEAFSCLGNLGWHDKWSKTYVISATEKDALKKELLEKLQ